MSKEVSVLKAQKEELSKGIEEMINDFQDRSGLNVDAIYLTTLSAKDDGRIVKTMVDVKVSVP